MARKTAPILVERPRSQIEQTASKETLNGRARIIGSGLHRDAAKAMDFDRGSCRRWRATGLWCLEISPRQVQIADARACAAADGLEHLRSASGHDRRERAAGEYEAADPEPNAAGAHHPSIRTLSPRYQSGFDGHAGGTAGRFRGGDAGSTDGGNACEQSPGLFR